MKATDEQVEELARWMFGVFGASEPEAVSWSEELPRRQGYCRTVARALLERPPAVLQDALGACDPYVVSAGVKRREGG